MKTSSALTLVTSLLAVAVHADVTWFDPIHDITCTGHADGTITCQKGHAAEHVCLSFSLRSLFNHLGTFPPHNVSSTLTPVLDYHHPSSIHVSPSS